MQKVAVSWVTWELTESTIWLAAIALLDIIPNVILMPTAGALADRFDRHKILLVACTLLLLQAVLLATVAWTDMLTIWTLAALVLAHGIFISFLVPAMYGTIPRFVARATVPSAIAVTSAYTQLAVFVGPALAGWIIIGYGTTAAFIVNAIGYLLLIIAFLLLKTPSDYIHPKPSSQSFLGDMRSGFTYIFAHKTIGSLLIVLFFADVVLMGFYHMLPAYSADVLGKGVEGLSAILAVIGLGTTCAALWLAHGGGSAVRINRVLWAFFVALITLAALVQTSNLYIAALIAIALGFAAETGHTGTMTIIQLAVTENQRGRVMGTLFMISQLAAGVGAYLIGATAVGAGIQLPVTLGVVIGLCIWVAIFLRRKHLFREHYQD